MVTILASAVLLWTVIGGIVAIVVCPLLEDSATERRKAPRKTA